MYRALDSNKIVSTLEHLQRRVSERFPGSSLTKVCAELTQIAQENAGRAAMLARPRFGLRAISALILAAGLALMAYVATRIEVKRDTESIYSTLQGIDAGFNIIILMGAAIIFLATLEGRWKRQQALADLNELRSIIHVIDMHQLTKDPSGLLVLAPPTASSPSRTMSAPDLVRYLDYCSEMLSLAAKVAAVYAQSSRDPQVVAASSDLQQMTANLSAKIWQKINIAERGMPGVLAASNPATAVPPHAVSAPPPSANAGTNKTS